MTPAEKKFKQEKIEIIEENLEERQIESLNSQVIELKRLIYQIEKKLEKAAS